MKSQIVIASPNAELVIFRTVNGHREYLYRLCQTLVGRKWRQGWTRLEHLALRMDREQVLRWVVVLSREFPVEAIPAKSLLVEVPRRRQAAAAGMSLVELLIVMVIILVLASIAIPQVVAMQQATQQTSALRFVRSITAAEMSYSSNCAVVPSAPAACAGLAAQLPTWTNLQMSAYNFTFAPAGSLWTLTAAPVSNQGMFIYADGSGISRCNRGSAASATSTPCN